MFLYLNPFCKYLKFNELPLNRWFYISIFTVITLTGNIQFSYATHSAGADLSYKCLGGLDYEITATFYRDCMGVNEPTSVMINYTANSCGYVRTVTAYKDTSQSGIEITMPCASNNTSCNGGSLTGIMKWVYKAVVTLPGYCNDWHFSYRVCCRNCSITTIQNPCQNGSELYVEAFLDNVNAPENNSPKFLNDPVAFVCVGQNLNYNPGMFDPDGDSLFFEIIDPKTGMNSNVTWIAPSSKQMPISSSTPFMVNHSTGALNFTPDQLQIGILTARIKEYREGVYIGSTIRDMQIFTQFCNNNTPLLSGINNTNSYSTEVCAGTNLCFDVFTTDSDLSQNVSLTVNSTIPGLISTISPGARPSVQLCWTPSGTDVRTEPYAITITVRDDACPFNAVQVYTFALSVIGPVFSIDKTDATCAGTQDGTIMLNHNIYGVQATWNTNPPVQSNTLTGLSAGIYTFAISNNNGCTITDQVIISEPDSINAQLNLSGVPCHGGCIGTGEVSVVNSSGLTYLWNTGATSQYISGLCNGVYSVTVSDSSGCSIFLQDSLFSSSGFQISGIVDDVECHGAATGSISLSVSGAMGPLNYLWSNMATTSTITNLNAGNYTVNVSDSAGCVESHIFNIGEPQNQIILTLKSKTDVTCKGVGNGKATVGAMGGVPPYVYLWSNNNTTASSSGLTPGAYTVSVTDSKGCSATLSFIIYEPQADLSLTVDKYSDVGCFNGNTGEISITATGGTSPYSFNWSNGATSSAIKNISAGQYVAWVTDSNGCMDSLTKSIFQPSSALNSTTNVFRNVKCFGDNSGSVHVNVKGGTSPYEYLWNTGDTKSTIFNLKPGIYNVKVTDSNGCSVTDSTRVTGPLLPLSVSSEIKHSDCLHNSKGTIKLIPFGGTPGYNCIWNTGATSFNIEDLEEGVYSVILTDINGCTTVHERQILNTSVLSQTGSLVNTCEGEAVTLEAEEISSADYTWYFNGEEIAGAKESHLTTFASGMYYFTVKKENCTIYIGDSIQVIVNKVVAPVATSSGIICPPQSAKLFAAGGVEYLWTPEKYIDNVSTAYPIVNPPYNFTYHVKITDLNGCSVTLSVPVLVSCDSILVPTGFSPNSDGINDGYVIRNIDLFPGNQLWIFNRFGSLVFKATNYNNEWDGYNNIDGSFNGSRMPPDTYFYILDLNDGSKARSGYIILKR